MATRQTKRKAGKPKQKRSVRPPAGSFAAVVEAVDQLSLEEQEELTQIVRRRLAEQGRLRIIREVKQAEAEFAAGKAKAASVREIMDEILS